MKSFALTILFVLAGTVVSAADLKPYDSGAMKEIMRSNGATVGALNKAISASDWPAVAAGFQTMAANAQKAQQYSAPKGDAKAWAKLWEEFLYSSWKGIGAAGEKDATKAKAALGELTGDRNAGHGQFM